VASGGPTTTAAPSIPVTGDHTMVPLAMGAVAAGTGLVLLLVRRRSA
jgi:LPXTG-motif cell wall-anchored protein